MKKKITLFLLIISAFACTQQDQDVKLDDLTTSINLSKAPIAVSSMAYTTPNELYSIYANNPSIVIHYNVARLLAETELLAGANFILGPTINPYDTWYLTPLPKVVYNYDNTPKYYEFGYVCQGQIVATITTYAKKEIAGVIAFIFAEPLNYDCPTLDYYVGKYPNRYYGLGGICFLKDCDEELEGELQEYASTDEEELIRMLEQMGDEDRDGIQQDMDEQGESLDEYIAERDEYWQLIDEFIDNNLSHLLTDEEPIGEVVGFNLTDFINGNIESDTGTDIDYVNQLAELLDYEIGYFNTYTLPEYSDYRLQVTRWGGFCGPAACAWVYRGKYNSYNGYYLPIFGNGSNYNSYYYESGQNSYAVYQYGSANTSNSLSDAYTDYNNISNEADNGLAACFYNETVPFWWSEWQFPLYHGGLNRGFRAATNDRYHVKLTCRPYFWITQNNEPVIIAIDCSHYIVAFGAGVTKKRNGNVKDQYFMVTDNGYTTAPSFRPYMRKKNFWNLHYGLTR